MILKFGPLEDKELVLLTLGKLFGILGFLQFSFPLIAKETGERAAKISTDLQGLKVRFWTIWVVFVDFWFEKIKMHQTEDELRGLVV